MIESRLGSTPVASPGIPPTPEEELVWRDAEINDPDSSPAEKPVIPIHEIREASARQTALQKEPEPAQIEKPPAPVLIPSSDEAPDADLAPRHILAPPLSGSSEDVRMITVVLRASGDKVRDNLRMRQVYGALISYPGNDRFAFLMYERGKGFQVEFPNFTTGWNRELQGRLQKLVGAENITVEQIKFH